MHNFIRLKAKKIVITGGPSTGKTSVIEQLEKEGHYCLHEVIRTMTSEEKNQGEQIKMVSNPIVSVSDPMKFNTKILNARIEQYKLAQEVKEGTVFFDRGIPDVLAYMDCFDQNYGPTFSNACKSLRYNKVFLMPPWKEIHISDNERFETFEESKNIYDCLKKAYENYSYEVIIIPIGSVAERVDFVLKQVKSL
ncbi:AAA family ATPase [Maribacter sp. HTCC2170]|uniref:AAA family ATPase n=1 Tax=Maribacter sp. (strain HTCC2170 / KCCM 42371) TaxID=313603 RepID=UPI00006BB85F|nr:ATP-binding protein [Maribacter sp. HTCC2170]EAQ99715.1 hypothetical protein FB2170_10394 [Maribacter sp. HTCC2170]